MFCHNCGKKNQEDAKFCESCGTKLLDVGTGYQEESVTEPPLKNPAANKANANKAIGFVLIALILGVVIFLGINYFGNKDDSSLHSAPTQNSSSEKNRNSLDMKISQIDNSDFPNMTLYTRIQNEDGSDFEDIKKDYFTISELGTDGKTYETEISEIIPLEKENSMNINLVIDRSGSMDENGKMDNAKLAATKFLDELMTSGNNQIEITSFDDYVYNTQPFTTNKSDLVNAIDSIETEGQTALYDAIYDALIQTNRKKGSRFIIAFTDGEENASLHSENEVIELSRLTGIPVYIIGIGSSVNYSGISSLAVNCNGLFYNAETTNLSTLLLDIYDEIYQDQKNQYKISYTSPLQDDLNDYRTVTLCTSKKNSVLGETKLDYMPKDNIANIDHAKIISLIENKSSTDDVAVAIVDLNTDLEYRVGNARRSYVASGFYAPIHIVASDKNLGNAEAMMSKMDNGAGNALIDEFGGLSAINRALSDKGYTQTTFNRKFGDVASSDRGNENYTSAVDSAKILRDIYQNGGYKLMNWELSKDGISTPSNATVYAHRGQGIGSAYNVYAIIESDEATYGIAIMTAHEGLSNEKAKEIAAPMISELLLEIHAEMTKQS